MSQTFTCPKCGAPQDYRGGSAPTIQCSYCDTTLIVPEALRTSAPNFAEFNPAEITREISKSRKSASAHRNLSKSITAAKKSKSQRRQPSAYKFRAAKAAA